MYDKNMNFKFKIMRFFVYFYHEYCFKYQTRLFVCIIQYKVNYCMSKKSWPNLYGKLLYKMGNYKISPERTYITDRGNRLTFKVVIS